MTTEFKRTHHGHMYGVPVWLDMTDDDCPGIEPKHSMIGECAWQIMNFFFGCFTWTASTLNPNYEPVFPIRVGAPV